MEQYLENKTFEDLTEKQIETFKRLLEENNITYEVMNYPTDKINNIPYEVKGYEYKNFKDFVDDLNTKAIAEIYLYKCCTYSNTDTGELSYIIRYTANKDLITNKTIKSIKNLVSEIKSSKDVKSMSTDKIKRILQKQNISEAACLNIIKLIRIFEKEFNTTHTGELNG